MTSKVFIFEVDGVRVTNPMHYNEEPTKEEVLNDMKEWFFENQYMWFSVKENGVERNLEDL